MGAPTLVDKVLAAIRVIATDIKAVLEKTDLLKTAAYKDVGTTEGMIPEFVGTEGIGGYGFGGRSKDLGLNVNLDTLPKINAIYGVSRTNVVAGLPADMQAYIYNSEMTLQVLVSPNSYYVTQVLTAVAYKPPSTSFVNAVVFIRSSSFNNWGPWERIAGKLLDVDIDRAVIGDDAEFNSVKAGATSPKIAFETIKIGITYDNFKYMPDGVSIAGPYDARGAVGLRPSCAETSILSMTMRIYAPIYASYGDNTLRFASAKSRYTGAYYDTAFTGDQVTLMIKTKAHLTEVGNIGNPAEVSGDNLFGEGAYAELFVIYKVD